MRIIEVQGTESNPVYIVKMGFSEIEMIHGIVWEAYRKLPKKVPEVVPVKNRMADMVNKMGLEIAKFKKGKPGYLGEMYVTKRTKK